MRFNYIRIYNKISIFLYSDNNIVSSSENDNMICIARVIMSVKFEHFHSIQYCIELVAMHFSNKTHPTTLIELFQQMCIVLICDFFDLIDCVSRTLLNSDQLTMAFQFWSINITSRHDTNHTSQKIAKSDG